MLMGINKHKYKVNPLCCWLNKIFNQFIIS